MKYGIFLPLVGEFVEPSRGLSLAQAAEAAGWDAVFVSDLNEVGTEAPETDPCIALAAIAATTSTLLVGLVTPVADRRRPWVLARQSAMVDHLSQGRLTFATGVGYASWHKDVSLPGGGPLDEGEEAMTFLFEESLAVLVMCWSGEPIRHDGIWLHVDSPPLVVTPLQRPRIPVWLTTRWPSRSPLRRAAHLDGILPVFDKRPNLRVPPEPDQVRSVRENLKQLGTQPNYDVALRGVLGPRWTEQSLDRLRALADAGATWWFETVEPDESASSVFERVAAGPPPNS
jgi:alkanesulfonate monooxygenase SsuD/methylene tetrahydromethanopterin reductase-like flavin-dependent oxidoreductase (luciferase family)